MSKEDLVMQECSVDNLQWEVRYAPWQVVEKNIAKAHKAFLITLGIMGIPLTVTLWLLDGWQGGLFGLGFALLLYVIIYLLAHISLLIYYRKGVGYLYTADAMGIAVRMCDDEVNISSTGHGLIWLLFMVVVKFTWVLPPHVYIQEADTQEFIAWERVEKLEYVPGSCRCYLTDNYVWDAHVEDMERFRQIQEIYNRNSMK